MSHTYLALDTSLISQSTKDNIPTFWRGMFSNDNSRLLIDGYNGQGVLVHPQEVMDYWLQWEDNPEETQNLLINTAIEYTKNEIKVEFNDPNSMWYKGD